MFKHTDLLDEQVDAHLNRMRRAGWLTFRGEAGVDLLRRVMHLHAPAPILIVHCHRRLACESADYDHFVPTNFAVNFTTKKATIEGTIGDTGERHSLFFDPHRVADPSGQYLSFVSTLASAFPREALDAVQIPHIFF